MTHLCVLTRHFICVDVRQNDTFMCVGVCQITLSVC